jgi:hypothetical protein
MPGPVLHTLIIIAAIIIPGGLLVYFAWLARAKCKDRARAKEAQRQKDPIEEIREAFLQMYPPESLRAKERRRRLDKRRRLTRRKFPNK